MNTLLLISIIIALWLACGAIAAGYYFAHFQRHFPELRRRHFFRERSGAVLDLISGPVSLITVLSIGWTKYGWLWPWSEKAKREAGL